MMKLKLLFFIFSLLLARPASAVVLDWSGAYEIQSEFMESSDLAWKFYALHNLHLKPEIKAFDGAVVRSWFQIRDPSGIYKPGAQSQFYYQEGAFFGRGQETGSLSPALELKNLYLEIIHDFGEWEMGWKPQHFGLGMYYNDGRKAFSPVYNAYGTRGFVSWKGFIGSSYYIQPVVHYINDMSFNIFLSGGWEKENYGIEGVYKWPILSAGGSPANLPSQESGYLGVYAYYKKVTWSVQAELGGDTDSNYGGVLDIDWDTPWKNWDLGLDLGLSSSYQGSQFYFDPSFSTDLSFLRAGYEKWLTPSPEYLKQYLFYSFHSGFYLAPSWSFKLSDSWSLGSSLLAQVSSVNPGGGALYGGELILTRQVAAGLKWINNAGVLFPPNNNWYVGINSRVVIAF